MERRSTQLLLPLVSMQREEGERRWRSNKGLDNSWTTTLPANDKSTVFCCANLLVNVWLEFNPAHVCQHINYGCFYFFISVTYG